MPDYVPFGARGIATAAQGNYAGKDKSLLGLIFDEEFDNQHKRSESQRLSYTQIMQKYPAWKASRGGLQWHNRRYFTNPEGSKERVPTFTVRHLSALRQTVPRATDRKGKTSWSTVREDVKCRTGKQFGMTALKKKWNALKAYGLHERGYLQVVADGDEEEWMENPDHEPAVEPPTKRSRRDKDEDEEHSMGGGASNFAPGASNRMAAMV